MNVVEISEENLGDFQDFLGEDFSEDIKRIYYNALGAVDDNGEPVGAFMYELLNSESEEDTRSRIFFTKSRDKEILDLLEEYYTNTNVMEDETVQSFYELFEEDDASFLSEKGFSFQKKEDDVLCITLAELAATDIGKKKKIPEHIDSIENISILDFRDAVKQILFKGHKGAMEDIPFLPKSWFDNKVSSCVSSGGRNPGLFLIRRTPSGTLIPALLFAYGPESRTDLLHMLRYSLQQALQLYSPNTIVKISRKNAAARALTNKLLPNKSASEIFYGERKEK